MNTTVAQTNPRGAGDKADGRDIASLALAGAAGVVFGIGLLLSGMANPAKVLGFLDLAGAWDPSLAFVMGGAIGVALPFFVLAQRRRRTLLGGASHLPDPQRPIDRDLVIGSLLFGVGWGLAGFCPGPALVAAGMGWPGAWLFIAAMLAGMALFAAARRGHTSG